MITRRHSHTIFEKVLRPPFTRYILRRMTTGRDWSQWIGTIEKNSFSRRQKEKNNSNSERTESDGKNRSHVWGLSSPCSSVNPDSVSIKRSVRLNVCDFGLSLQRPCFFLFFGFSFSSMSFHVCKWKTSRRRSTNNNVLKIEELITQYANITRYKMKWPQILPVKCRILHIIRFQHYYVLPNLAKKMDFGLSTSSGWEISSFAQIERPNRITLMNRRELIQMFHRLWVKKEIPSIFPCRNRTTSFKSGGLIDSLKIGSHVISKDLKVILLPKFNFSTHVKHNRTK